MKTPAKFRSRLGTSGLIALVATLALGGCSYFATYQKAFNATAGQVQFYSSSTAQIRSFLKALPETDALSYSGPIDKPNIVIFDMPDFALFSGDGMKEASGTKAERLLEGALAQGNRLAALKSGDRVLGHALINTRRKAYRVKAYFVAERSGGWKTNQEYWQVNARSLAVKKIAPAKKSTAKKKL